MMDLQEAAASLDFYADAVDLCCKKYELAIQLVAGEKALKDLPDLAQTPDGHFDDAAKRVADLVEKNVTELHRFVRESMALSIIVSDAEIREVSRLISQPEQFAKLTAAKTRNVLAVRKAAGLLQERAKKIEEQSKKAEPSPLIAAIAAWKAKFKEEQRLAKEEQDRLSKAP